MIATVQRPAYGRGMAGTILSILMLAAVALTGGGIYALVVKHERKRGWLMLIAGLVMFGNVLVATVPLD